MTVYEIEPSEAVDGGHLVRCPEHGEFQKFPAGQAQGSFYCAECDVEIDVAIRAPSDRRELTEWR